MNSSNQIPDHSSVQGKAPSVWPDVLKQVSLKIALGAGILILLYFVIQFCLVITSAIGGQAENFFIHLRKLFRHAPHMFHSAKGFGAFVELVLIAAFVGWTINRFRKK